MGIPRYIRQNGKPTGPFRFEQLRAFAASGRLKPDSLVSEDGKTWIDAARIAGLDFPPNGGAKPSASPPADSPAKRPAVAKAKPLADENVDATPAPFDLSTVTAGASDANPAPSRRRVKKAQKSDLSIVIGGVVAVLVGMAVIVYLVFVLPAAQEVKNSSNVAARTSKSAKSSSYSKKSATDSRQSASAAAAKAAAKSSESPAADGADSKPIGAPDAVEDKTADKETAKTKSTGDEDDDVPQLDDNLMPNDETDDADPAKPDEADAKKPVAAPDDVATKGENAKPSDPPRPAIANPPAANAAPPNAIASTPAPANPQPAPPPANVGKKPEETQTWLMARSQHRADARSMGASGESEASVELALKWLAEHQYADGSWNFNHQRGNCQGQCGDPGELEMAVNGATGLCLLPFLAAGQSPVEGKYKANVAAGVNYLISRMKSDGSLWEQGGSMYSHGIATMALCEAYGMASGASKYTGSESVAGPLISDKPAAAEGTSESPKTAAATDDIGKDKQPGPGVPLTLAQRQKMRAAGTLPAANQEKVIGSGVKSSPSQSAKSKDRELKQLGTAAQSAVNFIVAAQFPSGGWRYEPRVGGDTSVVGWQVMALKSADSARLRVPVDTVRGASAFLDYAQLDSGANYGYTGPEQPSESTRAIGLLCRMNLGWDRTQPALGRGVEVLGARGPSHEDMYFNFYTTQVMHHYEGPQWDAWNVQMRDFLVHSQERNGHLAGSWMFHGGHGSKPGGRVYNTALACLILEVYYRHKPIYTGSASAAAQAKP